MIQDLLEIIALYKGVGSKGTREETEADKPGRSTYSRT